MSEFRTATLPNGLQVVADVDNRGYSAAIGYFVRAGARDETDAQSGLSHFLEHMMFKGTATRSAADVNRELDELGGQSNAYTSEEQTVYYAAVLPKYQRRMVDLLSDMMRPRLEEEDFAMERHVILEEIAKYEDQPPFGAFERAMECCYGPRGLGRRVLGTAESIESMHVDTMRDYFRTRYRPANMVLAASGNVDFDDLVDQASQSTADWNELPLPAPLPPDDDSQLPAGIALDPRLNIPDATQAYRVTLSGGPSMASADRFAMRLLASIIGDDGGSRLFWDLIDTGRAEVATMWPQEYADTGALFSYLVCTPDQMDANIRLMNDAIDFVVREGLKQAELDQVINRTVAGVIMSSERPAQRLFGLGSHWLCCREHLSTDDLLDSYRRVDIGQIETMARSYLCTDATEVIASAETAQTPDEPSLTP
ncbi:M16 family metallopeptidase [Allorhodopirellula solitaria]|uniref:Insulinase (Peptidase family M16) n=1 Tax=Allorhodopirellula solitaria TaxID=2527987 RepID=A0A5C5X1D6_9BACT|nr:pitrilysin family protein [Allorhodopirellula solitaria]TWT56610.1 Insulinase (Peptidase family M16) [Allorhodopirellula solitaria]